MVGHAYSTRLTFFWPVVWGGNSAEGECGPEWPGLTGDEALGVTNISGCEEVGDVLGDMRSCMPSNCAAKSLGSIPCWLWDST